MSSSLETCFLTELEVWLVARNPQQSCCLCLYRAGIKLALRLELWSSCLPNKPSYAPSYLCRPRLCLLGLLESPLLCTGLLPPRVPVMVLWPLTNNLAIYCLCSKYLCGPHVSKYLQLLVSRHPVLQCICGLSIWYQFLCFYSLCIYYQYIHMLSKWSSAYDPSCAYILISKQASRRRVM